LKLSVTINELLLRYIPERIENDKEIVLTTVKHNGSALEFTSNK